MCPRGCCETYAEHLRGVHLGVTSEQTKALRRDDQDMHAYKRLRQSGVQPRRIAGSAELERGADSAFEVEHASIITNAPERKKMARAIEAAGAHRPSITPVDAA
jgi:hypothetical protein